MSLNIEDFPFRDWGLRMGWLQGNDGIDDLVLWQPEHFGDDETFVRLNPCHFGAIAKEMGMVTEQEAAQRVEKLQDRLSLLAALVRAHSPAGSPLRTAVDALLGNGSDTQLVEAPSKPLRSMPGSGEPTPAPDAASDLFGEGS